MGKKESLSELKTTEEVCRTEKYTFMCRFSSEETTSSIWSPVLFRTELASAENIEGGDSHLLIVTGKSWRCARRGAVISLSSTARSYIWQNFNGAAKRILEGRKKENKRTASAGKKT